MPKRNPERPKSAEVVLEDHAFAKDMYARANKRTSDASVLGSLSSTSITRASA